MNASRVSYSKLPYKIVYEYKITYEYKVRF